MLSHSWSALAATEKIIWDTWEYRYEIRGICTDTITSNAKGMGLYWSVTCHSSTLEASPSLSECDPGLLASHFLAPSLKLPIIDSIAVIMSFIWMIVC